MQRFLVMFRLPTAAAGDRARLVAERTAATASLIAELCRAIEAKGLGCELGEIGEPTSFGAVCVLGTERLAQELGKLPGVEAVVPD